MIIEVLSFMGKVEYKEFLLCYQDWTFKHFHFTQFGVHIFSLTINNIWGWMLGEPSSTSKNIGYNIYPVHIKTIIVYFDYLYHATWFNLPHKLHCNLY